MILIQVQFIYTIPFTFSFIVAMILILAIMDIIDHDLRIITEHLALKNHYSLSTVFSLVASFSIFLDKLFQSAIVFSLTN
jgi:hypothetical protein